MDKENSGKPMTESLIERVARAAESHAESIGYELVTRGCPAKREVWRDVIRAAIAAMREPTGEMVSAGEDWLEEGDTAPWLRARIRVIWRDMIDDALKG